MPDERYEPEPKDSQGDQTMAMQDQQDGVAELQEQLELIRAHTKRTVTRVGLLCLGVWGVLVMLLATVPSSGPGWKVLVAAATAVAGTAFSVFVGAVVLNRWEEYRQQQHALEEQVATAIADRRAAAEWARRHAELARLAAQAAQTELAAIVGAAYGVLAPSLSLLLGVKPVGQPWLGDSVRLPTDASAREGLLAEAREHISELCMWAEELFQRMMKAHSATMGPGISEGSLESVSTHDLLERATSAFSSPRQAEEALSQFDGEPWDSLEAQLERASEVTPELVAATQRLGAATQALAEHLNEPDARVIEKMSLEELTVGLDWEKDSQRRSERSAVRATSDRLGVFMVRYGIASDVLGLNFHVKRLLDGVDETLATIERARRSLDEAARWDTYGRIDPLLRGAFAEHQRASIEDMEGMNRRRLVRKNGSRSSSSKAVPPPH